MNNQDMLEFLKVAGEINNDNINSFEKYKISDKFKNSKVNSLETWYGKYKSLGYKCFDIVYLLGVMNELDFKEDTYKIVYEYLKKRKELQERVSLIKELVDFYFIAYKEEYLNEVLFQWRWDK